MSEPTLQTQSEPPNGKHFCTQREEFTKLNSKMSELLVNVEKQTEAIDKIALTIGGPSPANPLENTGLIGAVQRVQTQVIVRDKEDDTLIQSREELVERAKKAETALESRNKLIVQVVIAIATGIASGGGLTWLVKVLEAMK